VSDLLASKLYGVDYVIAPMIETPYALSKFVDAKNKVFSRSAQTQFLFNLETETALRSLADMLPVAKRGVDGIVFGRVDFTLSRGMPRSAINQHAITGAILEVARTCAKEDLQLVVGGAVTLDAIDALREVAAIRLDRFETRKLVFDGGAIGNGNIDEGIALAIDFELAWLKNKRDYYTAIATEDGARIEMLESRVRSVAPAQRRAS
jgi:hypothetical protein